MDIEEPEPRKLPASLTTSNLRTGANVWQVGVLLEDGLAWCIVLSYLISTDFTHSQDFAQRLKILTGKDVHAKNIINVIKSFNPFTNKRSCVRDNRLKNVVREFKINLKWDSLVDDFQKLLYAACLLKCDIRFNTSEGKVNFITSLLEGNSYSTDPIILFLTPGDGGTENKIFSFELNVDLSSKMRREALAYHLRQGQVSDKHISNIISAINKEDNFVIAALNNNCKLVISDLYCPSPILWKIKEIGYEIDPRSTDSNGLSAFYHALISCDSSVCYKLYYFAASYCFQSDGIYRKINDQFYTKFFKLEEILLSDLSKSRNFELCENRGAIEILFYSLFNINRFLQIVGKNLIGKENNLTYFVNPDKVFSASKMRETMLSLLNAYLCFFDCVEWKDLKINLNNVREYIKYKDYCDEIDVITSVLFFNNIHYLKARLNLQKKAVQEESEYTAIEKKAVQKEGEYFAVEQKAVQKEDEYSAVEKKSVQEEGEYSVVEKKAVQEEGESSAVEKGAVQEEGEYAAVEKKKVQEKAEYATLEKKKVQEKAEYAALEKKKVQEKAEYAAVESEFFILVLSFVIFKIVKETDIFKELVSHSTENLEKIYEIPLKIRINVRKKVECFRETLSKITVSNNNVAENVPIIEFYSILENYPVIGDHLFIEELKSYLILSQKLKLSNMKSIFVTERILQVIGESINPQPEHRKYIKWFLFLYFPKHIGKTLFDLRNALSHLKSSSKLSSKCFCEKQNYSLFKSIQEEIRKIKLYLEPLFNILDLRMKAYILDLIESDLQELERPKKSKLGSNIKNLMLHIAGIPSASLKKYHPDVQIVVHTFLNRIEEELNVERNDMNVSVIEHIISPLKDVVEWVMGIPQPKSKKLLDICKISELSIDADSSKNPRVLGQEFVDKCRSYVAEIPTKNIKHFEVLKNIQSTEKFVNILNDSLLLSDDDMDRIRKEVPQSVNDAETAKEKIFESIEDGFSLTEENLLNYKLFYLTKKNQQLLHGYYLDKNAASVHSILSIPDPLTELQNAISKNYLSETRYKRLSKLMKISHDTKRKIFKISQNKLTLLLDRINWMKKILITESKEISKLYESKSPLLPDQIVRRYLNNYEIRVSIEILFLDCMTLLPKTKNISDDAWLKSSKLYSGIYLRNVIAHGDILLNNLCQWLNPVELSSEFIGHIIKLLQDEECIIAILRLYHRVDRKYSRIIKLIKSGEQGEHICLCEKIKKCENYNRYIQLLK